MKLVDDKRITCIRLQQPQDRAQIQASLLINDGCRNSPNINLNVTVKGQTECNELLGMVLIEKPTATCSKVIKCQVVSSVIEEGHRVCGMECPCGDSANQCLIHLVNEINVENCEIIKTM